jgi:3-methyladenine DNA glycosylase/8-oxoguanine DNA glycosylase
MMARKRIAAADLGIDIESGTEREVFKWFLASFLFGKRISQSIAARAYDVIVNEHGRDTPGKIRRCSWQQLVDMLGEGHYRRYDESTAERLLLMADKLKKDYGGRLERLRDASRNRSELKQRLLEFNGVGPKTVEIFMREAAKAGY